jgi:hypothetical protein
MEGGRNELRFRCVHLTLLLCVESNMCLNPATGSKHSQRRHKGRRMSNSVIKN